eukprot:scaffold24237_cov161-Isochrysis_galbana.AAC.2
MNSRASASAVRGALEHAQALAVPARDLAVSGWAGQSATAAHAMPHSILCCDESAKRQAARP